MDAFLEALQVQFGASLLDNPKAELKHYRQ